MAELIEGITDHSNNAPPTHAATMTMGRYLQDQVRNLQELFEDLARGLGETNEAVADLKASAGSANNALNDVREALKSTNIKADTTRSDVDRERAKLARLQADLDATNNKVAGMRDSQKVNDTLINKMQQDLEDQATLQKDFRGELENSVAQDLKGIRSDMDKLDLRVVQNRSDIDTLQNGLVDANEQIRQINLKAKAAQDQFNEMDTFTKILEGRVSDGASGLKHMRINLEDLNAAALRLVEDHDNTKERVVELQGAVKQAHNHSKQVHSKLEDTAQVVTNATQKIDKQENKGDGVNLNLQAALARIQDLEGGADRANKNISDLKHQLAETSAIASAVRAGLKESNSLLLPNIHLDSHEARSASQRHGSLLHTGNMAGGGMGLVAGGSTKRTPRATSFAGAAGGARTPRTWA